MNNVDGEEGSSGATAEGGNATKRKFSKICSTATETTITNWDFSKATCRILFEAEDFGRKYRPSFYTTAKAHLLSPQWIREIFDECQKAFSTAQLMQILAKHGIKSGKKHNRVGG